MIDRRVLIALSAAALLASCSRHEEFRYRMTVEVESPQGLRTGSSVIEVEVGDPGRGRFVLPEMGTTAKVRGEAVAVDLPDGKVLFALTRTLDDGDAAVHFAYEALRPRRFSGPNAVIDRTRELKRIRRTGELPLESYPLLVTFADLANPASAKRVEPHDLRSSFGPGVVLKRITIKMVDAPVTFSLAKRLPWLEDYKERHLDGSSSAMEMLTTNAIVARLSGGSFIAR